MQDKEFINSRQKKFQNIVGKIVTYFKKNFFFFEKTLIKSKFILFTL